MGLVRKCLSKAIVLTATLATAALVAPAPVWAQSAVPQPCVDDRLPSGAFSHVCIPLGWNGQLVVFAHGYVAPGLPLAFYDLALADGSSLPELVQALGYGFATTSYRQNGLAILEGMNDIRELVAFFHEHYSTPSRTIVAGASEGGLIATLLAEQSPDLFDRGFAACGPIGDFRTQINYLADFRVLFDYFFPGLIPGSAIDVPPSVGASWLTSYVPAIGTALAANPGRALELLRVAKAPYDPAVPATIVNTTLDLLWYNVFAMADVVAKLGGNPFGNRLTWYYGSRNDLRLNAQVARFTAAPRALAALRPYRTTGKLSIPLFTLHTTGDDVVPIRQELLYLLKYEPSGRGLFLPIPVSRYGHCNFTADEALRAFGLLVA
ncbi:MAG: alpha/beta hydrolase family protein, partial [Vicinamibacterales bacterium]